MRQELGPQPVDVRMSVSEKHRVGEAGRGACVCMCEDSREGAVHRQTLPRFKTKSENVAFLEGRGTPRTFPEQLVPSSWR